MLQKIVSFFKCDKKDEDKGSSFRQRIEDERKRMGEELAKGNNVAWHRVIMAAVIGFVGVLVCAMFFAQHLLNKQQEELSKPYRFLQLSDEELLRLPSGEYMICGAFRPSMEKQDMIWLLCRKNGGVIVATKMPEGTEKPIRPPVSLTIDEDGTWKFTYPQTQGFVPPQINNNAKVEGSMPKE